MVTLTLKSTKNNMSPPFWKGDIMQKMVNKNTKYVDYKNDV